MTKLKFSPLEPTVKNPESFPSTRTLKRLCRPSEKQSLAGSLSRVNWTFLYRANAAEEKLGVFMNEVSRNMDKDLPLRYVKNYPMDKPWITPDIKDAFIVERLANCVRELVDHFIHPP